MNCLESRQLLQQRLDGEPIDRGAVQGHLASCAECAALHAAAGRLQEGLRLLAPPLAPAELSDRIVTRALAERRSRRRRRWLTVAAAAAAALLVAVLGYSQWPRAVEDTLVVPKPPAPFVHVPPEPAPSLRESVAEASSAMVNLTVRKADETVTQTRRLWPAVAPPRLDDADMLTEPLDPPVRSLREAGQNVSAGLEPVASSARRAFGMFLREFPPMAGDDKPGF